MSTTVMSVKTDREVKEEAQKLAKKMGFPLGTLINAFLRQFIRDKAVNFSMEPMIPMGKALEKELAKIEKDIKDGKNISPEFENVEDAIKYLRSA
ncbi:MAG: type II toxin-antitoxin system RelB/DinJ family antitoxin, partial [Candidatus Peregrinibacteria bacterium]|nr:type II toxin-antitoxin system RelB/DinJ family antitoxin [Candidatus Peregrinibacteria bacterium]